MALREIERRYSRFVLDALSYSKNSTPIQQFSSTIYQPTILKNSAPLQKRFYMKNREYKYKNEGWFHNSKGAGSCIFLLGVGAVAGVCSGKRVTVPYTERSHFIPFYKIAGRFLNDEVIMLEGEIVGPLDPDRLKAQRIFQDIIDEALPIEMEMQNKVGIDQDCEIVVVDSADVGISCAHFGKICVTTALLHRYQHHEPMIATHFAHEIAHDLARHPEEFISKLISTVPVTGTSLYLFSQSTFIRSRLMPFLALLNLTRRRFLPSLSFVGTVVLLSYLQIVKYNREMIMEADYIGLMLAASAGFNPRVGLMYPAYGEEEEEEEEEEDDEEVLPECFLSFPSGRKRSLRLVRPQILNKAMSKYREKQPTDST